MLTDTYHCNLLEVIERNVEADEDQKIKAEGEAEYMRILSEA